MLRAWNRGRLHRTVAVEGLAPCVLASSRTEAIRQLGI